MAGLVMSKAGSKCSSYFDSKRSEPAMPMEPAHCQNTDWLSGPSSGGRMLEASSSNTMWRALMARSVWVSTSMPAVGFLIQEAVSTRSPFTSTMQARQLPSGR